MPSPLAELHIGADTLAPPGVLTLWTCVLTVIALGTVVAHQPDVTDRALAFFAALPAGDVRAALRSVRPSPISLLARDAELARLPPNGALQPDREERVKLATLTEILEYHERTDIVAIKVIDVPQAFVGLHARSILLISRPALRLVSAAELQALVAHEMGHDYFWGEYQQAQERHDVRALRDVELKCDGIATLTLVALGLAPAALTTAARKVTRFNVTMDAVANADAYPSLAERERFVRAVLVVMNSIAEPLADVIVRLEVQAHVPVDAIELEIAGETAHTLLASAGILSVWHQCSDFNACGQERERSVSLLVRLVSLRQPRGAFVCGGVVRDPLTEVPTIFVDLAAIVDRVLAIHHGGPGRSEPTLASLRKGHLIGLTVAHEVGHALGLPHAASGVMKENADIDDILALRASRLAFLPQQAARMRQAVQLMSVDARAR